MANSAGCLCVCVISERISLLLRVLKGVISKVLKLGFVALAPYDPLPRWEQASQTQRLFLYSLRDDYRLLYS